MKQNAHTQTSHACRGARPSFPFQAHRETPGERFCYAFLALIFSPCNWGKSNRRCTKGFVNYTMNNSFISPVSVINSLTFPNYKVSLESHAIPADLIVPFHFLMNQRPKLSICCTFFLYLFIYLFKIQAFFKTMHVKTSIETKGGNKLNSTGHVNLMNML